MTAQRQQMEQALLKAQTQSLAMTRAELERTRAQLEEARRNGSAADERAMAALEAQAGARREARGEVITLPGALLFATGKSELSQAARARLDVVATALKSAPDKVILIEGYTDSTGTDAIDHAPVGVARASGPRLPRLARRPGDRDDREGLRSGPSHREQRQRGGARHQPPGRDRRPDRGGRAHAAPADEALRRAGEPPDPRWTPRLTKGSCATSPRPDSGWRAPASKVGTRSPRRSRRRPSWRPRR